MHATFLHALQTHAEAHPDQLALGGLRRDYTWCELREAVLNAIAVLRARGVTSRVALCSWNDEVYLILLLACQALDLSLVAFHPRWSTQEYTLAIEMAQPELLVSDLPVPDVVTCSVVGVEGFESWCAQVPMAPADVAMMPMDESPSLVMFTSGTTGRIKAVALSVTQLLSSATQFVEALGLSAKDRQYLAAPLFHIAGMGCLTLPLFLVGGATVLAGGFDAQEIVMRGILSVEATCMFMLPQMWSGVLDVMAKHDVSWPTARVALSGGAPTPEPLLRRGWAQGIPWHIGYGMTELAPMGTIASPQRLRQKPGCVGQTHQMMSLCIRNDGCELEPGQVGQVFVRGPNVFMGYWDAVSGVTPATDRDGWFGTRDMGYLDEAGDLWLCGRQGDMIITGGENVYPEEIERAILRIQGVDQAVVFGTPHPKWGEAVTVAIVGSRDWSAAALAEHLSSLSRYKYPRRVWNVAGFEATSGQKISRQILAQHWITHHETP